MFTFWRFSLLSLLLRSAFGLRTWPGANVRVLPSNWTNLWGKSWWTNFEPTIVFIHCWLHRAVPWAFLAATSRHVTALSLSRSSPSYPLQSIADNLWTKQSIDNCSGWDQSLGSVPFQDQQCTSAQKCQMGSASSSLLSLSNCSDFCWMLTIFLIRTP